tara:strand:- start:55 stop:234 length:180 start_codon:yes stop_codon:yes gene_type:complete
VNVFQDVHGTEPHKEHSKLFVVATLPENKVNTVDSGSQLEVLILILSYFTNKFMHLSGF